MGASTSHGACILIFTPREALTNLVGLPRPQQASSGEALIRLSAKLGSRADYGSLSHLLRSPEHDREKTNH